VRSITAAKPATTPIPVQLSAPECPAWILPHLAMPKRGPKCQLGSHRLFHRLLWVLYTGMQWQCVPRPTDTPGTPARHYTTLSTVFARWAEEGSLWQAFLARVRHLAAAQPLDTSLLHGDGPHTVATQGGRASGTRGTHTSRGSKSSRSRTSMAPAERLFLVRPCMQRTWSWCRRVSRR
jgi:transposase